MMEDPDGQSDKSEEELFEMLVTRAATFSKPTDEEKTET